MAKSDATTVDEYLHQLPEERRAVIEEVRNLILRNLPAGYTESVSWGMLTYEIPLSRYPDTYNGQPLNYLSLAAQKKHYALYLMCVYADSAQEEKLRAAYQAMNKKMDMGKSCLRFRKLEDLPMETLGEIIAATPPDDYIAQYEAIRKKVR
jgi:uncharacterized protein YdhG (YjbR/CyaY superfamily)